MKSYAAFSTKFYFSFPDHYFQNIANMTIPKKNPSIAFTTYTYYNLFKLRFLQTF